MLTTNNARAYAVLAAFMADFGEKTTLGNNGGSDQLKLSVEGYVNGRERGFVITSTNFCVVFSESRNSDSIVLYTGTTTEFNNGSPSSAAYERGNSYGPDAYADVAKDIWEFLSTNTVRITLRTPTT